MQTMHLNQELHPMYNIRYVYFSFSLECLTLNKNFYNIWQNLDKKLGHMIKSFSFFTNN